jgi:hypothetical protein
LLGGGEAIVEGVATVEASALFRELAAAHPGVAVWPDEGFTEGDWSYAWVVSRFGEGNVRNLAYVRIRAASSSTAPTMTPEMTSGWQPSDA